jgi:hypothetical protein
MKLIEKNSERIVYNSNVEGMEITFQKITDACLVLSLKKDNKLVDILFNNEEINSEAMLVVIGDSERKTQSFYNLILDDTNTSVCEDE